MSEDLEIYLEMQSEYDACAKECEKDAELKDKFGEPREFEQEEEMEEEE